MLPLHPSRALHVVRRRLLLWPLALVALIAGAAFAVNASAATLDAEGDPRAVTAPTEAPPVDDIDPSGFELAIDEATIQADIAAQQAAAAEAAAAQQAAAAQAAADHELLAASLRYTGGPSDAGLAALRACESSGNYGSVSSSGSYRGAYQFSQQTWDSIASRRHPWLVGVDPAAAVPADQDAQARALYDISGPGQWPHCGRHL
jgi:resuscitation-promoting factor RpfB